MKEFEFSLILSGVSEFSEELADRLFAAGCDDATPVSRDGVALLHFDREAESLQEAIRSAISYVQLAGCKVAKVEMEPDSAALKT